MILTLDVGNSQIYGGVFGPDDGELLLQFRKTTKSGSSSDEMGLFLRSVLKENGHDPDSVRQIAFCSVVPDVVHSLKGACTKYFDIQPFILQTGARTGLKIKYRNPVEVGADRIANAVAATHLYPGRNIIVADLGTATTFCAITADKDYLGGLIMPGLRTSMEALELRTARLPAVEILAPSEIVGRSTVENIQSGLYFSNLFAIRGITEKIRAEAFGGDKALLIGTGGFSRMFEKEKVFDALIPELVLLGLNQALKLNTKVFTRGVQYDAHYA
jgi:type III pantothenate kinase